MAAPTSFKKAELRVEGGPTIPVLFNPREYTIAKSNQWTFKPVVGATMPPAQFSGGMPRTLNLSGLLLDASLAGPGASIRPLITQLFDLLKAGTGGGASDVPPFVTFAWGAVTTFKAVVTQLTVAHKLFQPNGEPIRAEVTIALTEAEQSQVAPPTNPTTRALAGLGVHTVKDGDSLQSIAYRTYGDATKWRVIAEANDIDNPIAVRRGRGLVLPRLES